MSKQPDYRSIILDSEKKCLQVKNNDKSNGTLTDLGECYNNPSQLWYYIVNSWVNEGTKTCLDTKNENDEGIEPHMWECNPNWIRNQEWVRDGKFIKAKKNDRCLTRDLDKLKLKTCSYGNENQFFTLSNELNPESKQVLVYESCAYLGKYLSLSNGTYDLNWFKQRGMTTISSFKMAPQLTIKIRRNEQDVTMNSEDNQRNEDNPFFNCLNSPISNLTVEITEFKKPEPKPVVKIDAPTIDLGGPGPSQADLTPKPIIPKKPTAIIIDADLAPVSVQAPTTSVPAPASVQAPTTVPAPIQPTPVPQIIMPKIQFESESKTMLYVLIGFGLLFVLFLIILFTSSGTKYYPNYEDE